MEEDKILQEQIKNAPTEIKNLLTKGDWSIVVSQISRKNNFSHEQTVALENEVLFVLLSMELSKDLVRNMQDVLEVQESVSQEIAREVNEKIFKEVEPFLPTSSEDSNLIESLHDENSAENIRQILKANTGEDRDKLIANQLKKLPEALQQAIRVVPWKSVVKEIALLNKLDLAQIVAVERETMFVIYGFEDEKNYLSNVMREAKLDEAMATTITAALNERVFKVIVNKVNESGPASQNAATNVPEIPPANLPMIEKGEVVHDAAPTVTKEIKIEKSKVSLPDYRYPNGKDPYREPLV
ncbi:MAG: hypothetical protein Q7R69_01240 [bacterium]|nr:hypothetical protein [bacterium]